MVELSSWWNGDSISNKLNILRVSKNRNIFIWSRSLPIPEVTNQTPDEIDEAEDMVSESSSYNKAENDFNETKDQEFWVWAQLKTRLMN